MSWNFCILELSMTMTHAQILQDGMAARSAIDCSYLQLGSQITDAAGWNYQGCRPGQGTCMTQTIPLHEFLMLRDALEVGAA